MLLQGILFPPGLQLSMPSSYPSLAVNQQHTVYITVHSIIHDLPYFITWQLSSNSSLSLLNPIYVTPDIPVKKNNFVYTVTTSISPTSAMCLSLIRGTIWWATARVPTKVRRSSSQQFPCFITNHLCFKMSSYITLNITMLLMLICWIINIQYVLITHFYQVCKFIIFSFINLQLVTYSHIHGEEGSVHSGNQQNCRGAKPQAKERARVEAEYKD